MSTSLKRQIYCCLADNKSRLRECATELSRQVRLSSFKFDFKKMEFKEMETLGFTIKAHMRNATVVGPPSAGAFKVSNFNSLAPTLNTFV